MYEDFFGFKERPFQLVPNPAYLFLSKSHEEAIAHLKYAISHGDGFVGITGEVGTGKTTLCRVFLNDLDKDTEVAYIFNPQLNAVELLRTINDEFGISSQANNIKDLIDTLNAFLMEKKSQKKNALLLIDEAQNLSKEVLEQLRLLSNLETSTSKLLQIILVGQPELQNMLDSYELRQLQQRITLSWYLTPLSRLETKEYIRHRVKVAAKKTEEIFTEPAYYRIYRYSNGIPRLINIACDRALLTAFGFNRRKVTGAIARNSIRELQDRGGGNRRIFTRGLIIASFILLVCLVVFALVLPLFKVSPGAGSAQPGEKAAVNTAVVGQSVKEQEPVIQTHADFAGFLGNLTQRPSRFIALKTVISLWETTPRVNPYLNNIDDDSTFFQFAAARNNFYILQVKKDWELIKNLNLPAVLEFLPPGALSPRYLALTRITGKEITLKGGEKEEIITVSPENLHLFWSGNAYIPWKDFFNYKGDIPLGASQEAIFTLEMLLVDIGFKEIKPDQEYDEVTLAAVKKIQEKHGIPVDGIVGARTKIVIYNEKKDLNIPHIRALKDTSKEERNQ